MRIHSIKIIENPGKAGGYKYFGVYNKIQKEEENQNGRRNTNKHRKRLER